MPVHKGNSDLL